MCVCLCVCVSVCVPDLYFEPYDRLTKCDAKVMPLKDFPSLYLLIPTIGNNNMADARTSEEETKYRVLLFGCEWSFVMDLW